MIFFLIFSKHALSQSGLDNKLTGMGDFMIPTAQWSLRGLSDRPSFHEEDPGRG